MFLRFNQFCGGPVFIEVRNTGIMCWGYSLSRSLSLWDDLVFVTVLLAFGLEQSNTYSITPVTLAVNSRLSQAVCYNLNLYFVSDCDDLTEKNKRICLDLQFSLGGSVSSPWSLATVWPSSVTIFTNTRHLAWLIWIIHFKCALFISDNLTQLFFSLVICSSYLCLEAAACDIWYLVWKKHEMVIRIFADQFLFVDPQTNRLSNHFSCLHF